MRQRRSRQTPRDGRRRALARFFKRAGRLKSEPRIGWFVKLGLERPESVADHTFRTALLAMVYSDIRNLDAGKAVRMALLHDLAEAIVGDSIPGQRTPSQKRRMEVAAMRSLVSDLPDKLAREYLALWEEFEEGKTEESVLVKQLDKLEMAIQASEYKEEDANRDVREFLRSARSAVRDREMKLLLESL